MPSVAGPSDGSSQRHSSETEARSQHISNSETNILPNCEIACKPVRNPERSASSSHRFSPLLATRLSKPTSPIDIPVHRLKSEPSPWEVADNSPHFGSSLHAHSANFDLAPREAYGPCSSVLAPRDAIGSVLPNVLAPRDANGLPALSAERRLLGAAEPLLASDSFSLARPVPSCSTGEAVLRPGGTPSIPTSTARSVLSARDGEAVLRTCQPVAYDGNAVVANSRYYRNADALKAEVPIDSGGTEQARPSPSCSTGEAVLRPGWAPSTPTSTARPALSAFGDKAVLRTDQPD